MERPSAVETAPGKYKNLEGEEFKCIRIKLGVNIFSCKVPFEEVNKITRENPFIASVNSHVPGYNNFTELKNLIKGINSDIKVYEVDKPDSKYSEENDEYISLFGNESTIFLLLTHEDSYEIENSIVKLQNEINKHTQNKFSCSKAVIIEEKTLQATIRVFNKEYKCDIKPENYSHISLEQGKIYICRDPNFISWLNSEGIGYVEVKTHTEDNPEVIIISSDVKLSLNVDKFILETNNDSLYAIKLNDKNLKTSGLNQ